MCGQRLAKRVEHNAILRTRFDFYCEHPQAIDKFQKTMIGRRLDGDHIPLIRDRTQRDEQCLLSTVGDANIFRIDVAAHRIEVAVGNLPAKARLAMSRRIRKTAFFCFWKWIIQEVTWPSISRADDNGDGRLDLFALSRWGIWIYHSGPDGLPSTPSRKLALVPFDPETERRHEATVNNYFARDLDGDTRADLLLNTIVGGLMDGRSRTQIQLNRGTGVSLDYGWPRDAPTLRPLRSAAS